MIHLQNQYITCAKLSIPCMVVKPQKCYFSIWFVTSATLFYSVHTLHTLHIYLHTSHTFLLSFCLLPVKRAFICACTHIHSCTHTTYFTHLPSFCMLPAKLLYTHTRIHTRTHTHTCAHTHTHTHTHTIWNASKSVSLHDPTKSIYN